MVLNLCHALERFLGTLDCDPENDAGHQKQTHETVETFLLQFQWEPPLLRAVAELVSRSILHHIQQRATLCEGPKHHHCHNPHRRG